MIEGSWLRLDSKERAWEEIDGRMRTAVRKAQKSGVTIRRTKGTPKEIETFLSFCLNPDDFPKELSDRYHFFLAEMKGAIIAGILLAEVEDRLFMLCHASTPTAKELNVPSLLLWHVVEEFAGKKYRVLDVGASYRSTLQNFFSGWRTQGYPMIMQPPELKPTLLLTPFDSAAYAVPVPPNARALTRAHLEKKFQGKPFTFFPRGMYAIAALVRWLRDEGTIARDGNVYVTTTTDAHYVSSCVSSAIEQTVPMSRTLTEKTSAIFAIHEFGFPHPRLAELRWIADERKIPLIEDCAYGWGTKGIGTVGDYTIYSLTKAFPVQFGGYLVGKQFTHEELWNTYRCSDRQKEEYTEGHLARWLERENDATERRRENYEWYRKLFGDARTFFPLTSGAEPGAFVLTMRDEKWMETVGAFVRRFGVECGNYWKSSAIILPVHQRLEPAHREYIAGAVFATEREWCGVPGMHP